MGRRAEPFEDTLSGELYRQWVEYCKRSKTIPNAYAFCQNVLPVIGYQMKWSTFRYHLAQMRIAQVVTIDKLSNGVILQDVTLV